MKLWESPRKPLWSTRWEERRPQSTRWRWRIRIKAYPFDYGAARCCAGGRSRDPRWNPRLRRRAAARPVRECGDSGGVRAHAPARRRSPGGVSGASGASPGEVAAGGGRQPRPDAGQAVEGGPSVGGAGGSSGTRTRRDGAGNACSAGHGTRPWPSASGSGTPGGPTPGPRGPCGRRPPFPPAGCRAGWGGRSSRR